MITIVEADNLDWLEMQSSNSVDLVYIDPPFNTGKIQQRTRIKTVDGKRTKIEELSSNRYSDSFDDFTEFIRPRLEHAHRILKDSGSLFFHIDYREAHYSKVLLDQIFGRSNFINEIIWAYDYGGRAKKRWSAKHDNIFWYTKSETYTFNFEEMDRIPYMAPGLQKDPEKAAKGKTPTDVWWHTIVPTNGKEKTGYPTQKPLGILERILKVHTNPGDLVVDFFAGSGTTGEAAAKLGRDVVLVDDNSDAIEVMRNRLSKWLDE